MECEKALPSQPAKVRRSSVKVIILCCSDTSAGLNELFLDRPILAAGLFQFEVILLECGEAFQISTK